MVDHDCESLATIILLIEYVFLLSFTIRTVYHHMNSDTSMNYTHYYLFSIFVSSACFLRIIESLQLALGLNKRLDYFFQLFVSACIFSCFSTVSSLWVKLLIFSRLDQRHTQAVQLNKKSVLIHVGVNAVIYAFLVLGGIFCYLGNANHVLWFRILNYVSTLVLLCALSIAGLLLAQRVRLYVQTAPSKLYYWIVGSIVVFVYKVIVGTLVLTLPYVAELIDPSFKGNHLYKAILIFIHFNLTEILPFVIFKSAIKISTTQAMLHSTHAVSSLEDIYDIFSISRDNLLIEDSLGEVINPV